MMNRPTNLVMEVWESSFGLVLAAHLLIGSQVKHPLKLLSGHECVCVEEWVTSDISCEPVYDGQEVSMKILLKKLTKETKEKR